MGPVAPRTKDLLKLVNGYWELREPRDRNELLTVVAHWKIRPALACGIMSLGEWALANLGVRLWIISGGRTCKQQMDLQAAGRPAIDCDLSTHVIHPTERPMATGADIGADRTLTRAEWKTLACVAGELRLRWAGHADPNHFDLGPRRVTG